MCRDCETLQELVSIWHDLSPEVRQAITELCEVF